MLRPVFIHISQFQRKENKIFQVKNFFIQNFLRSSILERVQRDATTTIKPFRSLPFVESQTNIGQHLQNRVITKFLRLSDLFYHKHLPDSSHRLTMYLGFSQKLNSRIQQPLYKNIGPHVFFHNRCISTFLPLFNMYFHSIFIAQSIFIIELNLSISL